MRRDSKLRQTYHFVRSLGFYPVGFSARVKALPHFFRHLRAYNKRSPVKSFRARFPNFLLQTQDMFESSGSINGHYFWQDLWAAMEVYKRRPEKHIDIGSRIDGFVAHVLPFCPVEYVDIRPMESNVPGLSFRQGSVLELPYPDASIDSLSSLHVIEHIGLGRYGDPIDPDGHRLAAQEMARCLAPGGMLLLSTPVGRERVVFDAHRIFDPQTIVDSFAPLTLKEFHLIPDSSDQILHGGSFEYAREQDYGCGLFIFTR
jgi:hypothetical protein